MVLYTLFIECYYFNLTFDFFIIDVILTTSTSEYSYKKSLTFLNIKDEDRGAYECRAKHINQNNLEYKFIDVFIHGKYIYITI